MKRLAFVLVALMLLCLLVGCDFIGGGDTDFNSDLTVVLPEDVTVDHFTPEPETEYYTSDKLILSISVNGYFMNYKVFSLEGDNRVYDELYLYEGDYFYAVSGDMRYLYATLGDPADTEYATEERESGYDIQINIEKSGVYTVKFDVNAHTFDLVYKREIDTPRYYTMPSCVMWMRSEYYPMEKNPDNDEEFCLMDVEIGAGDNLFFGDRTHVSSYNFTSDGESTDLLTKFEKRMASVHYGGRYNVYMNSVTYTLRLEPVSPDAIRYTCFIYKDGDFITLTPYDEAVPYIIRYRMSADEKDTRIPTFYTESYEEIVFTATEDENIDGSGGIYYLREVGTYDVILNFKTFELTVERLPE